MDPTMTGDPEALGKLVQAVNAVMEAVPAVRKTGHNSHHRYSYASDADLLKAIQPAMKAAGLALIPHRVDGGQSEIQGKQPWRFDAIVTYRLVHEAGGWIDVQAPGCGVDGQDKGPYKAMTGAFKYVLRQVFAVPTGDDPEYDGRPRQQEQPRHDTWQRDQGRFHARLQEVVGDLCEPKDLYSHVCDWCEAIGRPWPSRMDQPARDKLLDYLATDEGKGKLDTFIQGARP